MMYSLYDLLIKMGAPEVKEKKCIEWHYFDDAKKELAGFAEIKLDPKGHRLTAELKHLHKDFHDEDGNVYPTYTETFYLEAERIGGSDSYRVAKICFDDEEYLNPRKAVIELGLSLFHARALDISIRMVEQTFNKQDMFELAPETETRRPVFTRPMFVANPETQAPRKETFGVVIPFRPRVAQNNARV